MKRIIFIQHEPLTPNIEKRYCISEMIASGFEVLYWDISQVIYPGLKCADELNRIYLQRLNNYEELEAKCKTVFKNDILIPEFFFTAKNKKLWKLICTTDAIRIKIERYGNSDPQYSFIQKILIHLNPTKAFVFIKNYFFYLYCKKYKISPYNKVITSSCLQSADLQVNHPDYDDYLVHKNDSSVIDGRYICFIDTGFGIHPDHIFYENDKSRNNILWQKKLNAFFDYLENKYKIPVVIASHPKIAYPVDAFAGRKKIKYKTLNLVLNSEFVLQDVSNALSFTVIGNKKLGLITTEEMYKREKKYLLNLSKRLGIQLFNIDKMNWNNFEPKLISEPIRNNYLHNFLCSNEKDTRLSSTKIIDYLKDL